MSRSETVKAAWNSLELPNKNWGAVDEIQKHTLRIVTGDENQSIVEFYAEKYLSKEGVSRGLSVGSGRGEFELELSNLHRFEELLGLELNPKLVEYANRRARETGHPELRFEARNLERTRLPSENYGAAFAFHSLHHIRNVRGFIQQLREIMKDGALLFVYDYVGPNRFQWTQKQVCLGNKMLKSIPEKYRVRWRSRLVKKTIYKPGLLRMLTSDPSEAVDSESILPALKDYFETVEVHGIGGTLLCPVLHDIGWNFTPSDSVAHEIMLGLIAEEQNQMRNGTIQSDFVVGIYRKS